jgi:hypothetical protein
MSRHILFGGLFLGVMAIALVTWGAFFLYNLTHQEINGSVQADGTEIGNWTLTPDICQSGLQVGYFGAQFFSSKDHRLAMVYARDPVNGDAVHVNIPGTGDGFHFDEEDCKILTASFVLGPMINYVRAISGTINVDCEADASRLQGHLSFTNCH